MLYTQREKMGTCVNPPVDQIETPINKTPQQKKQIKATMGLPNLGQTCYLNTALQMMFTMDGVMERLRKRHQYEQALLKTYEALAKQESSQDIQTQLSRLIQTLEKQKPGIKIRKQEDIRIIIQILFDGLEDHYTLHCRRMCACDKILEYRQKYVPKKTICQRCNQEVEIQLLNTPKYLLQVPRQFEKYQKKFGLKDLNGEDQVYEFIFMAQYLGDGNSGHYISYKRQKDQWFLINDSLRREVNVKSLSKVNPILIVYQLKEARPNQIQ